jgi:hypothetical protein
MLAFLRIVWMDRGRDTDLKNGTPQVKSYLLKYWRRVSFYNGCKAGCFFTIFHRRNTCSEVFKTVELGIEMISFNNKL